MDLALRFSLLLALAVPAGELTAQQPGPESSRGTVEQVPDPPVVPADSRPSGAPSQPEKEGSAPVPEPTTLFLVGTGLVGLALGSRRWRRTVASRRP